MRSGTLVFGRNHVQNPPILLTSVSTMISMSKPEEVEHTRAPRHIIVATDLSERADRAVERARRLASGLRADLTMLHVVDESLPMAIAQQCIKECSDLIPEKLTGIRRIELGNFDVQVTLGSIPGTIIRAADVSHAELNIAS